MAFTIPTAIASCRDREFDWLDAGLNLGLDCLSESDTTVTVAGWTVPVKESCRDGV